MMQATTNTTTMMSAQSSSVSTSEARFSWTRTLACATFAGVVALTSVGCSVMRDQQTVGAYVDDAAITTAVKARFAEDKTVSALAINVETLNGTVQLAGFAKTQAEKDRAEDLAKNAKHVKKVINNITVRP